jgi:hypothetical protein
MLVLAFMIERGEGEGEEQIERLRGCGPLY